LNKKLTNDGMKVNLNKIKVIMKQRERKEKIMITQNLQLKQFQCLGIIMKERENLEPNVNEKIKKTMETNVLYNEHGDYRQQEMNKILKK